VGKIGRLVLTGAVVAATVFGGLAHPRTATVTVELPPRLESVVTPIDGSRGSGFFPTRQVTVSVSDTVRVPTSPFEAGTYATGSVVFSHYSGCTRECWGMYEMPAGYELLSRSGIAYRTLADVWWKEGTISAPVGIRAEVPGPAGNTGPHTIFQTRLWPGWMVPDNPKPITGGTSRITHRVAQADIDGVLAPLHDRLQTEVQNAMAVNASVLVYQPDGTPRYTYTTDHAVGDETPAVTVTMTASLSANGFSDRQARALIAAAMPSHIGPVRTSYMIWRMSPDGDVRILGFASAFTVATPDRATWQRRLASMTVAQARAALLDAFPAAEVDIKNSGAPALPAEPDRINLVFEPLPSYPA
jgi:hypothetical protein